MLSSNNLENGLQNILTEYNFKNILSCKCGVFHEFCLIYDNGFKINFLCTKKYSINIENIYNNSNFCYKCKNCKENINFNNGYFRTKNQKVYFKCNLCFNEGKSQLYTKLIEYEVNNENNGLNVLSKFKEFIKPTNEIKNEFFIGNLKEINKIEKLLNYLIVIIRYFPKDNKTNIVINNFFNYFNILLEIAFNNIIIYDVYNFKKECNVYGDDFNNTEFKYERFKEFYTNLYQKCLKKKYLSIQMMKFLDNKYYKNLSLPADYSIFIHHLFKENKRNIQKEVLRICYLTSEYYRSLIRLVEQIESKCKICEIENKVNELTGDSKLDNYYNSFLNIISQFSTIRKNISFILYRIINVNANKINLMEPNIKIVNMSFAFLRNIKHDIYNGNIKEKEDSLNLKTSILTKLESLENTLTKYKNFLNRAKNCEYIKELNYPLIFFTEEEKNYIQKKYKKPQRKYRKIKVDNKVVFDQDLQNILDYLFQLKEIENNIIHINGEEQNYFYPFFKNLDKPPEYNSKDIILDCMNKIEETILLKLPEIKNITYEKLIDYTFYNDINKYMISDDKMNYLLSFLNAKRKKLGEINYKYKNFEKKIKSLSSQVFELIDLIKLENDTDKYDNFIKKLEIKKDHNKIIEYLNNILCFIIPNYNEQNANEKKEFGKNLTKDLDNDVDEEEEEEEDDYEIRKKKFLEKEESIRKEIKPLLNYDPKFLNNIEIYLKHHLNIYIEELNVENEKKIKKAIEILNAQKVAFSKLETIMNFIKELKLYKFDFKSNFKEFIETKEFPKKIQALEINNFKIIKPTYENFINKIKNYIGNKKEKVDLLSSEPYDFIFRIFKVKAGFDF